MFKYNFITGSGGYCVGEIMLGIRNRKLLIQNGRTKLDRKARRLALDALEAALKAADPEAIMRSMVEVRGDRLSVGQYRFDLRKFRRIYVVGGGKASGEMAEVLESVLGSRISGGVVSVPYKTSSAKTSYVRLHEASHPIPDDSGVTGVKSMLELVSHVEKDDMVICLISGGGSSLMPLPRGEITLAEKRIVTDALLKSGATINEINTVRKHISEFKGGWLAKKAYPATIVNLILSDVLGDPLDFIASGPTVPDSTTFDDAVEILRMHSLWEEMPKSVKNLLNEGQQGLIEETPKDGDKAFEKVFNLVIGNNRIATLASCNKLGEAGVSPLFLTASLEGEARHIGTMLASIAKEVEVSGNPLSRPCGIVAGGEATVKVVGCGRGGRNQEIALSAALGISGMDGVVIASFTTDGIDGPTDAAGALVDGKTIVHSQERKLDAKKFLEENDSYHFFSELNDLIFTGHTGTNVNDISMIVMTE